MSEIAAGVSHWICDAKEAAHWCVARPVSCFGKLFWVLQEHGYEDETYLIVEIRASNVRYPIEVNVAARDLKDKIVH